MGGVDGLGGNVEGMGGDVEGLRGDVRDLKGDVKPKFHQELRSSAPSDSTGMVSTPFLFSDLFVKNTFFYMLPYSHYP